MMCPDTHAHRHNCYSTHGCRCDACREAHRLQARKDYVPVNERRCPPDHAHSNYCYTHHKCRCESCRAVRSAQTRARYARMSAEDRKLYNQRSRASRKDNAYKFEPWQVAVAERVARDGKLG